MTWTVSIIKLGDCEKPKGVIRVSKGTVHLTRSPGLQGLTLDITYVNPTGESCTLENTETPSFVAGTPGPYKIRWRSNYSSGELTVLVDPIIRDGDKRVTIDKVSALSHLTKCCGPVERWGKLFNDAKESGYNMIHLTPLQELGVSNSSYSLHSHLKLAPSLKVLNRDAGYEEQLKVLALKLKQIHDDTGLFFLTDVVWNHVSICNREVLAHPEAYFNLHNTPNLIPAYLIDRAIAKFGKTLEKSFDFRNVDEFTIRLKNHLEGTFSELRSLYKINSESTRSAGDVDFENLRDKPLDEILEHLYSTSYTFGGGRVDKDILKKILPLRNIDKNELDSEILGLITNYNDVKIPQKLTGIEDNVVNAVVGTVNYRFVEDSGPKLDFSKEPLLVDRYFHITDMELDEELSLDWNDCSFKKKVKTCNGWSNSSMEDMSKTMAYTNREVVIWGDSVKLRYGTGRADSPWLWDYMGSYTGDMARLFHGFRIDNCHNTPLPVGEALLRAARKIRPDLYVVAELFTGSEQKDCEIINTMGISSCIRELSQAASPRHLGELIYHYGESNPCGSFIQTDHHLVTSPARAMTSPARAMTSRPQAMLMDQTHDNPCPLDQHPLANMVALSAAMCSARCSVGSNKGYDQLVPHHLHVVEENRLYAEGSGSVGIILAKSALLALHETLERENYSETFVDQATEDVIVVTRHNPVTCSKILVVIATKWNANSSSTSYHEINLPGAGGSVLLEVEMCNPEGGSYSRDSHYITGTSGIDVKIRKGADSNLVKFEDKGQEHLKIGLHLSPGCVIAVKVDPPQAAATALAAFNSLVVNVADFKQEIRSTLSDLALLDYNYILYRCESEERYTGGGGVYHVPGYGDLAYCGLVGFVHVLEEIRDNNDTGHPLCRNLCEGWWPFEYTVSRIKQQGYKLGEYLEKLLIKLRAVPNYMRPKVFEFVVRIVYSVCEDEIIKHMPGLHRYTESASWWLMLKLALTSVQLAGRIGNLGISKSNSDTAPAVSMAAGLPHFSEGFMRCWGRDTFIALPGLLITTGRLEEARDMIVGFGRTLRYGLIPNLLSERGHRPRYNCRDAVWWWCRSIILLYEKLPDILTATVDRLYLPDDTRITTATPHVSTILEMIHEVLRRHASGINFVEDEAGPKLDEHLLTPGFHITAGVDPKTGFVRGGSRHNCGTWMDKVGSSHRAGNRGIPATPRDGAAIELVALCYQTVRFLSERDNQEVVISPGLRKDYESWAEMIKENFELSFWNGFYYNDTVGSETGNDGQCRPNQALAMVVSPALFHHLTPALTHLEESLSGPVGMATLAPLDGGYRPCYDNGDESGDFSTGQGFNYHQGPEWVWCKGFYLRAQLRSLSSRDVVDKGQIRDYFSTVLSPHRIMIHGTPFRGLTELTNKDGDLCPGSCPTQAWSSGCLLEFLAELEDDYNQIYA